jgi:hypothetical protein
MELRPETDSLAPAASSSEEVDVDPFLSAAPDLLRRLYRREGLPVLQKYALTMQRRFPSSALLGQCVVYPERPAERVARLQWRATLPGSASAGSLILSVFVLLLGHIHVPNNHTYLDFYTYHGFSRAGIWMLRLKRFLAASFQIILGVLVVCGGAACVCLAAIGFMEPHDPDAKTMLAISAVCLAVFIASAFCFRWTHRLRVPASLRFIEKAPFRSSGMMVQHRSLGRPLNP